MQFHDKWTESSTTRGSDSGEILQPGKKETIYPRIREYHLQLVYTLHPTFQWRLVHHHHLLLVLRGQLHHHLLARDPASLPFKRLADQSRRPPERSRIGSAKLRTTYALTLLHRISTRAIALKLPRRTPRDAIKARTLGWREDRISLAIEYMAWRKSKWCIRTRLDQGKTGRRDARGKVARGSEWRYSGIS